MKKALFIAVLFLPFFADAQIKPLVVYSSNKFWLSDKTSSGTGFINRNSPVTNIKYLFSFYRDQVVVAAKTNTVYKIKKTEAGGSNSVHYQLTDPDGQQHLIVLLYDNIDGRMSYTLHLSKMSEDGRALSMTTFILQKVK